MKPLDDNAGLASDAPAARDAVAYTDSPRPPSPEFDEAQPAPERTTAGEGSLLDAVFDATLDQDAHRNEHFERFRSMRIRTPSDAHDALLAWCRLAAVDPASLKAEQLANIIGYAIGEIDRLLNDQVNAIIHHPRFQQLEASWCGLKRLVEQVSPESKAVRVRVLNISWKQLSRDMEKANEFDQSQLFKKVYEEEFGTPNGQPFGALIGDYQITNSLEDLETLEKISGVAASAFAPFVASADPSLLDLKSFADLDRPRQLGDTVNQPQFAKWRSLRESEDARFVGLTMPRVLMRRPYQPDGSRGDGFGFREQAAADDARSYLWGNAAYAFGSVLIRTFQSTGWLADIHGVRRDELGGGLVPGATPATAHAGGLVEGYPVDRFSTDHAELIDAGGKPITETIITDEMERELSELGFIPLCHCQGTTDAAFYSVHSIQSPRQYDDDDATANAQISAMLQYVLCASRFAHFIKVMVRDKVGSLASHESIQDDLMRWISDYVRDDDEAPLDIKARFPLREGRITVQPSPVDPSKYTCEMLLKPHFQLDALTATVRLTTDMKGIGSG